jgi:hypothetical protein
MCFSAPISFATSALLLPIGLVSFIKAYRYQPNYIGFSLIPIFFAIQQFIEGFVWLNLQTTHSKMTNLFGYSYLFFAYCFWPAYFSFAIQRIESIHYKKRLMGYAGVLGIVLALILYLPIIYNHPSLRISIAQHSIYYSCQFNPIQQVLYNFFYLGILFFSCMIADNRKINLFGLAIMISYVVSGLFYIYSFTSVWCFFAAILSVLVYKVIPNTHRS